MMKAKQISHIGIIVAAVACLVSMQVGLGPMPVFEHWVAMLPLRLPRKSGISGTTYDRAFQGCHRAGPGGAGKGALPA